MVEGPVLSTVEGPVLSMVEGPVLSTVEGPVLSMVEGRGIIPSPLLLSLRAWSGLHRLSGMMMFLIMLIHLAQHWKWIVSAIRRCLEIEASKRQQQSDQIPEG